MATGPDPGEDFEGEEVERVVRAAACGSREALGALFRRFAEDVYRVAYRIAGTRADAEDTLQDVFVGLPRALSRYREQGRFGGWLRQVTIRTALSRIRARERHTFESIERADRASRSGPGDALDRIELARALAEMPDTHRIVFLLKEVEGYDHTEIGALLAISPGAARVRLHRAWRFLEARLHGADEPRSAGGER